jgi:hypothetical protein
MNDITTSTIVTAAAGGRRRHGTAAPRWGWSGVAPLTAVQLSASDIDLRGLLPGHHSEVTEIVLALCELGGKYHRYLHQDELGPTRAERMAALRLLLDQLDRLLSLLNGLPGQLRLRLSKHLASDRSTIERDIDNYRAHRDDEKAVQQVAEAAVDEGRMRYAASARHDAELMDELSGAAEQTVHLICAVDTTAAGAVAIDTELPPLEVDGGAESDVSGFAVACSRIERLRRRVELTLTRLERQKGPERCESLRWLVWQLCDLYHHETGRRVTNSAVEGARYNYTGTNYTGTPQSPAGRFVLAAVQALQPSEAWVQEPDHRVAPRRDRILDKGGLGRAVYFAMREYVADHPPSGLRRGRRRRAE